MLVRFWGTRGSIATPGQSTVRYGGNTSCVEVRSESGSLVLLDCGTGARPLGLALSKSSPARGSILIGHTHWDHIQGLPFFAPLFVPGNEWDIYAPGGFENSLRQTLAGQMQYTYFPVSLDQLGATIRYHDVVEGDFTVGDFRVRAQYLNHPALTLGYRLEADGAAIVYACDHEPHAAHDADAPMGEMDRRHAAFADADLVIHDAQYVADEYEAHRGWGHSTAEYAVEVARAAGAKRLALTHHDPTRNDEALDRVVERLRHRVAAEGSTMDVFAAAEGQTVELRSRPGAAMRTVPPRGEDTALERPATRALSVLIGAALSDTCTLLLEAIEAGGIIATVESDGANLLARAAALAPSIIILDHGSPGIDPMAVCRSVRDGYPGIQSDLPVIVVADRAQVQSEGAAAGVDDWLVRPFSGAYARARVRSWLIRSACRWVPAPEPANEPARIAALEALEILDTGPEERFDRLTRIAANLFDMPTALVSLVDRNRQWFKSAHGLDASETPRESSFCAHVVVSQQALIVPDTLEDDRFAENPLVTGEPRIRFYAGQPILLQDGQCVGTLCLIDTKPRQLDESRLSVLKDLTELVRQELEST